MPAPPSSAQALAGATVLVNLSASNETIGKANYRRQLVLGQSGRCMAAYVYASCGVGESTTDVVFGGHCLIAENGSLLAESRRFLREDALLIADVDLDRLRADRQRSNSFLDAHLYPGYDRPFAHAAFALGEQPMPTDLRRPIEAHPFVPQGQEQLRERCDEIFHIQVAGLAKRLEHIGTPPVAIGISGGLDSTLALLVACKTMDTLCASRQRIHAFTLPGFGTSNRTRDNARALDAPARRHGPRGRYSLAVSGGDARSGSSSVRHRPDRPERRGVDRTPAPFAGGATPRSRLRERAGAHANQPADEQRLRRRHRRRVRVGPGLVHLQRRSYEHV